MGDPRRAVGGRGRRLRLDPLGYQRGDLMLWLAVTAPFLILGLVTLVSASQQWEARREVQAVAAAAARAGAQPDGAALRRSQGSGPAAGPISDLGQVRRRVAAVVSAEPGAELRSVIVGRSAGGRPPSVTVEVAMPGALRIPGFGPPGVVVGRATAVLVDSGG